MNFYFVQVFYGQRQSSDMLSQNPPSPHFCLSLKKKKESQE